MEFKDKKDIKCKVKDSYTFDEKGSTFLAMRRVVWGRDQNEMADDEEYKLELRRMRYYANQDKEMPDKGFAFLTEEGPHNLGLTLLEQGYVNTGDALEVLSSREDFQDAVKSVFSDEIKPNESGEVFDPRKMMLGE